MAEAVDDFTFRAIKSKPVNHLKKNWLSFIIVMSANLCVLNVSKAGTPYTPNSAPSFSGGTTQSLSLCQNASATTINTLLSVNDADVGQTETWSVTSSASHGSVSASYSTTSTGSTLTPTGLTYTPTAGYSGADAFTVRVSDGFTTATTTINVTVNALPTITLGSNPSVCNGTTSANLTYSATTNSPNQYSIAWSAGGIIAGYSNVSLTSLPASPISLTVPSNPGAGSYTGTLTIKNSTTGCSSTGSTMGVTVNALPTITFGSNPSICNGTTSASLTYSATTNSPNQYSVAWSAGAIIAGYSNVSLTSLPASPISLTVPSNPGAGSYTGTLTVKNTTTGCSSTGTAKAVVINALPTITLGSNPSVMNGTTNANLTYSATTSSPNQYSLAWSAGGIIAGFSNVSLTSLPASPIGLTVPSNPGAGSYTGTLTVKNTTTGCSSTGATMGVTVTANTAPVFTGGSTQSLSVCQDAGATAINTLLTVSDVSAGQTETWTVTSGPSNGSLGGFSTTAGSGSSSITPTGLTYTPTAGYNGADAFTIQVSDGIATASKTINVTVNALTVITSSQTQTQDVSNASGNYTDGSCNIISNVQPSGANPVSGNITAVIWVESSVPSYGGKPFVARHYEITPATNATTATGTVTLYFLQSEFDAFNAAPGSTLKLPMGAGDATGITNLRIGKYSGISSDNSGLPGSYSSGAIVIDPVDANVVWNATAARWEVTFNVAGFSGFIAQTSSFVLPVTWVSFTAAKQNENTLLKWQTTAETNSDHFVIEYSTDGHQFTAIGTVAAAGNSNYLINYSFVHNAPQKENNYYRIMQVDHDGHKNYSVIRMIRFNTSGSLLLLMNPVRDGQLQVQFNKAVTMAIFDARGRLITRQQKGAGSQAINVSVLPRGVYLLQAGNETRKFIIE